jgi:hypothetical protein
MIGGSGQRNKTHFGPTIESSSISFGVDIAYVQSSRHYRESFLVPSDLTVPPVLDDGSFLSSAELRRIPSCIPHVSHCRQLNSSETTPDPRALFGSELIVRDVTMPHVRSIQALDIAQVQPSENNFAKCGDSLPQRLFPHILSVHVHLPSRFISAERLAATHSFGSLKTKRVISFLQKFIDPSP